MPILEKLRRFLDENGVPYDVRSHPTAYTANAVAEVEHVPRQEVAKVVMLRSGGDFLMAVLPAPLKVDLAVLRDESGNRDLHLATEVEFARLFPQCEPGAMPPFGNLYDLPVWVDRSLGSQREIVFNAGNHRQTVHMAYADFARLVRPRIGSFAKHER